MKRQDLDRALQNNQVPNAIMLYGESHFLIERYTRILSHVPDASILSFYHSEYHFESAKAHLSQGSLFGGRNVLIIKNEKKVPKKELEILVEFCAKNPDNIFIYAYYGSDFKKSATAAFGGKNKNSAEVRFFNPYDNEAKNIILQEAQAMGISMDHYSASHLLRSQNGDLGLACNELSKLQLLNRPISTKEIDAHVYGLAEVKLDSLILELLNKQDFRGDLERLLEHGEDEIRIITALSSFVTQLYLFNIYIKVHGVANSIDILGFKLPAFIEKERAALSIRFKHESYESLLSLLLESELKMKSSAKVDKHAILLSTLIRMQRLL